MPNYNSLENITFQRVKQRAAFKVVGWNGVGKKPKWLQTLQDSTLNKVPVVGWVNREPAVRLLTGMYVRPWKKGDHVVYMINESEEMFQGGEFISFWADTLEDLLHFTKDVGIEQSKIITDGVVSQKILYVPQEDKKHRPHSHYRRSV